MAMIEDRWRVYKTSSWSHDPELINIPLKSVRRCSCMVATRRFSAHNRVCNNVPLHPEESHQTFSAQYFPPNERLGNAQTRASPSIRQGPLHLTASGVYLLVRPLVGQPNRPSSSLPPPRPPRASTPLYSTEDAPGTDGSKHTICLAQACAATKS